MRDHLSERRWFLGFSLLVLIPPSCANDDVDPIDDAACEKLLKERESVDAIDWLKTPSASSKIHCAMSDEQALAIAVKLQELGATSLLAFVDEPGKTQSPNPKPMTDEGMVVRLPSDAKRRAAIFQLYAKQTRSVGYAPQADTGQSSLFIRWSPR